MKVSQRFLNESLTAVQVATFRVSAGTGLLSKTKIEPDRKLHPQMQKLEPSALHKIHGCRGGGGANDQTNIRSV